MKNYNTMTPAALVAELERAGWPQGRIAEMCDTTQATISRIGKGVHQNPGYLVVDKLRELVAALDDYDAE